MPKKNHHFYFKVLCFYFIVVIGTLIFTKLKTFFQLDNETYHTGRKLLEVKNCTPHSIEEFPQDFMSRKQREQGGIVFHIFISIYLFMTLAILCDDYFVESLERICEVLHLKPDVAGATFMAAGSSAPELCTSIIGSFIAKSDVGVSTIIGSAIFNVLCIVAICGLLSGIVIHLTWWPMLRDSVIYCLSVIVLIIVLNDGFINWYEALIMIILYILYIIFLYYNDTVYMFVVKRLPLSKPSYNTEYNPLLTRQPNHASRHFDSSEEEEIMETGDVDSNHSRIMLDEDMTNLEGESTSVFEIPDSFCLRLYWVSMLPIKVLCFLTIPDCRKPGILRKMFFLTFIMSVLWISLATYVLVWMIVITGDTLRIPDTVMGMTLLAAGTSVPDALSSFLVAKDGLGDMAISNGIGSNIFDILICLGVPWIIKTGFVSPGSTIQIISPGLLFTSIILLSTVVILIGCVTINKWRLNKLLGFIFLVLYLIIITFSCLYELNIFGDFILPSCPYIM